MLNWVENRLLAKSFYKLRRENTQPENMRNNVYEKAKCSAGKVNRTSVYAEAAVQIGKLNHKL